MVVFHQRSRFHHQNFIGIHDSIQPVSYCEYGTVGEFPPDCFLDQGISSVRNEEDCGMISKFNYKSNRGITLDRALATQRTQLIILDFVDLRS